MKTAKTIACVVLLSGISVAGQTVIAVTDAHGNASPVRNTGTATLSEETSGRNTLASDSETWVTTNVSTKPIVALIEQLLVEFPDGAKVKRNAQYELFFHPDPMLPGGQLSFSQPSRN